MNFALQLVLRSALIVALSRSLAAEDTIHFNRDIRPILAEKCLHCHGQDANARQADLRLDVEEEAKAARESGPVLVPGDRAASTLWQRISSGTEDQMPPRDQPRQLTEQDKELLGKWLDQGAPYEDHWSLIPPIKANLPVANRRDWAVSPIDLFVLARLEQLGWTPTPEADKATLIRRVTLDLIGLPPTPEDVDAFIADKSPDAYERLVDRLLASPRYGERMAQMWLDVARYADSGGYQGDILRSMWPWRDWVITAFNQNLGFDEFTRWQLAGDLLPNPSLSQRIATGFHRNHRINDEDGIIHEEFRVEYVADRLETTAAVWMGLTLGCARCHDHKYDPFTQRDYYRLFGFFNSVNESGRGNGNAPPLLYLPTAEQEAAQRAIDEQIARLETDAAATADPANSAAVVPDAATPEQKLTELRQQKSQLQASMNNVMVMQELAEPRPTYVLYRGAYDQPRDQVQPGVPETHFPNLDNDVPPNRLALANWLLDAGHPLTARVAVNRIWQLHFGSGLVRTPEDFGTRGEPPTHPELLDWLAVEFRDSLHWDVKALQRQIVTSATYQQASAVDRSSYERDPDNRWLSRGARFRLPAELIRDQSLAATGLLDTRLGGPSVRPYQPEGLWKDLASAHLEYEPSHGADLFRRSMYTFIRRTVPPPSMVALDMPNRELCSVRRPRTNTPIQALVLMNDPTYVEAARLIAEDVLDLVFVSATNSQPSDRVRLVFRRILAREPLEHELSVLLNAWHEYRAGFEKSPDRAAALVKVGERPANADIAPSEIAALAAIASIVMNTDEAVTRE